MRVYVYDTDDEFRQPCDVSLTQNVRPKEIKRKKKNLFLNGSSVMIIYQ